MKKSHSLPTYLDKLVEESIEEIRPFMKQDYYRSKLKEHAWTLYQEELQKGYDEEQAEAQTMKSLGDKNQIRSNIEREISQEKQQSDKILWRYPHKVGILFLIISLMGWCFVIITFIKNPYFLIQDSVPYPYSPSHNIFVVTCITTGLTLWLFYFSRRLKNEKRR